METTSSGSQTKKMVSDIKFETLENTRIGVLICCFQYPIEETADLRFFAAKA
jgi:hypothetical protein